MALGSEELDRRFNHHPPDDLTIVLHVDARSVFKEAAQWVDANLIDGREKALVMTNLEEAMFWANASIARNPSRPSG